MKPGGPKPLEARLSTGRADPILWMVSRVSKWGRNLSILSVAVGQTWGDPKMGCPGKWKGLKPAVRILVVKV